MSLECQRLIFGRFDGRPAAFERIMEIRNNIILVDGAESRFTQHFFMNLYGILLY